MAALRKDWGGAKKQPELTGNQIPLAVKIGGQWRFKANAIKEWSMAERTPTRPGP